MKCYDELKGVVETIQQPLVGVKRNERAKSRKEGRRFFKEFDFAAGMFKGALAEGWKTQ